MWYQYLAQVSLSVPQIATQDSGVSWGALVSIIGVIGTIGIAAMGMLYNMLKGLSVRLEAIMDRQNIQFTAMFERVDAKIEKVEIGSREARKNMWSEQNNLRERMVELKSLDDSVKELKPIVDDLKFKLASMR